MEGVWVHWLGGQGFLDRVILIVRGYIWNALVVLLVLPPFGDTGSLGYPLHRVVYCPSVSSLVIQSRLLEGNRETELKPTTLSSLLLLRVFLSFLFS